MLFKFILMAVFVIIKLICPPAKILMERSEMSTILILSPIVLVALASVAIILALKSGTKK